MAWTAPRTYTTGELITAAILNTHVRDNFNATGVAAVTTLGDLTPATGANAVARMGVGADNSTVIADSACTVGMKWAAAPTTLITACRLTAAASINIAGIASGYKALRIYVMARVHSPGTINSDSIDMRFESNNNNWYSVRDVISHNNARTTVEGVSANQYRIGGIPGGGTASGAYGNYVIDIPYYDSPLTFKSVRSHGHSYAGSATGQQEIHHSVGVWRAASVITSIQFLGNTCTTFAASSQVLLYGLA